MVTPQCEKCRKRIERVSECVVAYRENEPGAAGLYHRECAMALGGERRRAQWFGENDNLEQWYEQFEDRRAREIGLLAHRWVNQHRYYRPHTGFVTIWDTARENARKRKDQAG